MPYATGNSGGDVARRRRLEGDVADLEPLQDFVSLPLVVDGDVVGRVELALRVVVHVHVNAVGDDAPGAGVELEIDQRLERAAAVEHRIEAPGGALSALILLAAKFHSAVELEAEVGVVGDDIAGTSGDSLRRLGDFAGVRWWLLRGGKTRRCHLAPHRFDDGAPILLERRRPRRLDLRCRLAIGSPRSARDRTGGSLSASESPPSLRRTFGTGCPPSSGNRRIVSAGVRAVSDGSRTVSFGRRTVSFTGCCAPTPTAPATTASETDKTQRCMAEFTVAAGSQSDEPPVYFTP